MRAYHFTALAAAGPVVAPGSVFRRKQPDRAVTTSPVSHAEVRPFESGGDQFAGAHAGETTPAIRRMNIAKRIFDAVASAVMIVTAAPFLVLVAALIRLDSRGPAVFSQVRVGTNGAPFKMYKFRSMHADAEACRAGLESRSDRDGICFKSRNDPRITRVGRFLRRYSIDELPQIFNVLIGNMSLVGPRPALPQEVALYPAHALERLKAKPGITGIWQISGRADVGFDEMIEMDIAYVRCRTLRLDAVLLAMTARAVISGHGAY